MTENIKVCKRNGKNKLIIIDEKKLTTELNESEMQVYATYQNKKYVVQGYLDNQYIEIAQ